MLATQIDLAYESRAAASPRKRSGWKFRISDCALELLNENVHLNKASEGLSVSSQNSHVEILLPNVIVLGDGGFGCGIGLDEALSVEAT